MRNLTSFRYFGWRFTNLKMKFFVSFLVFLLCVVYSHQLIKYKNCSNNKDVLSSDRDLKSCGIMECLPDGSVQGKGCGTYNCAHPKGYKHEDPKKPYPECCGGPICD